MLLILLYYNNNTCSPPLGFECPFIFPPLDSATFFPRPPYLVHNRFFCHRICAKLGPCIFFGGKAVCVNVAVFSQSRNEDTRHFTGDLPLRRRPPSTSSPTPSGPDGRSQTPAPLQFFDRPQTACYNGDAAFPRSFSPIPLRSYGALFSSLSHQFPLPFSPFFILISPSPYLHHIHPTCS